MTTTFPPPSSSYLVKTISAVADANGSAFALLKPDVGQYWAPSIIRVSTGKTPSNTPANSLNINSSYCAVYHGATNQANSSTFLDDTFLGSGDSSSIVAGTIVLYGEAIMAQWSNVTIGDVCLLTIYGRSSIELPSLQREISPIPGARFSGNTANSMLWDYNDIVIPGPGFFTGTGPAIGPTFMTPFNLLCEVQSISFTVVTTATAGTRAMGVQAQNFDGAQLVPMFQSIDTAGQAPSQSGRYTFSPGSVPYGVGSAGVAQVFGGPIPQRVVLPGITSIQAIGVGTAVGDTWSNFIVVYRQYRTLGKVSFP